MTDRAPSPAFPNLARRLLAACLLAASLLAAAAAIAFADGELENWRGKVAAVRRQVENDVPAAYREALRLHATLPNDATPADHALAFNLLARSEIYLALPEAAAADAESALKIARANGDKAGQAEAYLNIALNAINQGQIDAMGEAASKALTILDGIPRPDLLGEAMLRTALMYRRDGQLEASVTLSMQALDMARHSGNPLFLAYAYHGMGIAMEQSGRYEEAAQYFREMEKEARTAGYRIQEAFALLGQATSISAQGQYRAAENLTREATAILRTAAAPHIVGHALFNLADRLRKQGKRKEALLLIDEVAAIYTRHPSKIGLWWTLNTRSDDRLALGQVAAATSDAEQAYALAKDIDAPFYLDSSARQLAALAAAEGDHRRAYTLAVEAAETTSRGEKERSGKHLEKLTVRYQTEAKQRQIEELTRQAQRHALEQKWLWTILAATLILLVVNGAFLLRQRRSNQLQTKLYAQLEQTGRKLQATLDAVPDLLFEVGLDGRIHDYHSPRVDLLALPPEQFLGRTMPEILPPEAAETCMAALHEADATGTSSGRHYALLLPQGTAWFELSVARKPEVPERSPRFIMLARDISQRKRAEEALSVREREFRTLAENIPDHIVRYDARGRRTYLNSATLRLMGMEAATLLGRRPEETMPAMGATQIGEFTKRLQRVLETGEPQELELALRHASEGLQTHHLRFTAERDEQGRIVGALLVGRDITECRQTEESLRASEQMFRTLVERAPDNIARYDRECRRIYINPETLGHFGLPAEAVLGKTPLESSLFLDAQRHIDLLRHVLETGEEIAAEMPFRSGKGEIRWAHARFVPERGPDGAITSVLAIARDVSELKESEQRFRTLAENFPDLLVRFDCDGRLAYANPAVARTFGLPAGAVVDRHLHEPGTDGGPGPRAWLETGVRQALDSGQPNEQEAYWQTGNGGQFFEMRYIPERDAAGQVVNVLAIGRDVTRLREAELALRVSEREFRTLTENSPNLIVRYDRDCRRLYVNPAYLQQTELTRERAIAVVPDRNWRPDISMPADEYKAKLRAAMATGEQAEIQMSWTKQKTGEVVHHALHIVPEHDLLGNVTGVLAIGHDITALKIAESRLRESYDLLQELASRRETAREEERKRIAREIHDELGQQLTALRLKVNLLNFQFGATAPALREATGSLLGMVDSTIQVARNVSTALRPAALDMGIVPALDWLAQEFRRNTGVACELGAMPADLDLGEEQSVVLFRIAQEALTNVVRHAGASRVRIALEREGCRHVLEIADDGSGFDPGAARLHKFGLLGMRERALAVGGEIEIDSTPGRGTRIRASIPAIETEGAA